MLEKMLKFNPGERVTSEQALADPYFDVYSYPDDEPVNQCPFQIESYVDDFMSDVKVIDLGLTSCLVDLQEVRVSHLNFHVK